MQQYLINTTAIWLLSLLLFDVFLRRESYHSYNRFYLLSTLLLGAILPLVQWANPVQMYTGVVRSSVERVAIVKQNIAVASSPAGTSVDWARWLLLAYVVGAVIALCLLAIEIIKLWRLSFAGKRSLQDGWQIIETGNQHAPFSFMNRLYVSGKEQYDTEEWRMILVHEGRHTSLLHIADLTLLHLARIIFWFHPLVYIYHKRLLLVHEYQADDTAAQLPQQYGRFLIEQAVLHSAPSITHSFNRSPIKNRIVMLTRNSTTIAKVRMFIAIPLLLVCVICFTKDSISQSSVRNGNTVNYRGNKIEYAENVLDVQSIVKKEGNAGSITRHEFPVKLNGKKIYRATELTTQPKIFDGDHSFSEYIFGALSPELDKLPDGTYRIDLSNFIVDENGKMVYYDAGIGLCHASADIPEATRKKIMQHTDEIINSMPLWQPGTLSNKKVPVLCDIFFMAYEIEVKHHHTQVTKLWDNTFRYGGQKY